VIAESVRAAIRNAVRAVASSIAAERFPDDNARLAAMAERAADFVIDHVDTHHLPARYKLVHLALLEIQSSAN